MVQESMVDTSPVKIFTEGSFEFEALVRPRVCMNCSNSLTLVDSLAICYWIVA
jgi:hypothetical protein